MSPLLLVKGLLVLVLTPACVYAKCEKDPNVPNKDAFMSIFIGNGVPKELQDKLDAGWDGQLCDTLEQTVSQWRGFGWPDEHITALVDRIKATVAHRDDPSWKSFVADVIVTGAGGSPELKAKLEKVGPERMPKDVASAKKAFLDAGLPPDQAESVARFIVWHANVKV